MNPLPLQLLVVEDNPGDARLVQEMLRGSPALATHTADRLTAALDYLGEQRADVVILDLGLPDSQGLETLRAVRSAAPSVPIVVLTGQDDDETGQNAMREGAQDYVVKGRYQGDLSRAIRYAIERNDHLVKSEHLNRVLRALRRLNQLITIEKDAQRLVQQACELLVDTRGFPGSWILLAAGPGFEQTLVRAGSSECLDPRIALAPGQLPFCCEQALRSERGMVVLGSGRDCDSCPFLECAGNHVSAVAVLRHGSQIYGFLGVEMPPSFVFDGALLLDIASDLGFALHSISVEQQQRQLETSLAQNDRLATMGMLAASIAHEINNPLTYVLSNLESLADDLPNVLGILRGEVRAEETRDAAALSALLDDLIDRLQEALKGSQRIRDISKGLWTFSRVESTSIGPVDLHRAIEDAVTIAYNEVRHRAQLVRNFGSIPPVPGSPGKLAQVFLNLLVNAAHAMDEARLEDNRIIVRTWNEGGYVFAEVADTGRGIAPGDLPRIFQPFFSTKGPGRGSGLGLSICRTIVTDLGGRITAESEIGGGTRFTVKLPVAAVDAEKPGVDASQPAATPAPRGRVLVVDDDPGVRRALARTLRRKHDVVTASSGETAVSTLEADQAFDVVFLDLMMPGLSGIDVHGWLVEHNAALAARSVFVTGGVFTQAARDYLGENDNRRVEKPFDPEELYRLTAELVAEARGQSHDDG